MPAGTEIVLIRHAPVALPVRLAGRTDVAVAPPGVALAQALRALAGPVDHLWVSPARRCRVTAQALFPAMEPREDARLWEQDFGDWEGADPATLPDLGALSGADLARHRPPGGESFADLCARVAPALSEAAGVRDGGRVAVVAHAGTVRAGLALALGAPGPALAFEVAPLSATLLRAFPVAEGFIWSVGWVNRVAG